MGWRKGGGVKGDILHTCQLKDSFGSNSLGPYWQMELGIRVHANTVDYNSIWYQNDFLSIESQYFSVHRILPNIRRLKVFLFVRLTFARSRFCWNVLQR